MGLCWCASGSSSKRLAAIEELLADNQEQMQRLLDLYLTGDFAREMLVEHKAMLEAVREALQAERDNLMARLEAQTITGKQAVTIKEFAQKIASGLDEADKSFEARRQIIELLDARGTLALENEEKVIYVQCAIGEKALSIMPTSQSTAQT